MTPSETLIYKNFARRLFKEAEAVPAGDEEATQAVASIADQLIETYKEKVYADGFMTDVKTWMELKRHNTATATQYSEKIKLKYPEIFESGNPAA